MKGEISRIFINPDSIEVLPECLLEPSLADTPPEAKVQFERLGYFCADTRDCKPGAPVFNRITTLRDTWARIERSQNKS